MKHRFLLLTLATLLAATPAARAYDFSAPATSNHILYFNIIDSANHYVALTYPNENSNYITGDLVVPATVQHDGQTWTVRAVGHAAFINCPGMTSCVLPETVIGIGRYNAFGSCHNMTSITLPASLKSIDQYAFYQCDALQEVHYTGTIEQWCKIKFINWNSNPLEKAHTLIINGDTVRDLVLPEGLDTIRYWAFKGCNLRSVSFPHSIRYISYHAFEMCDSLTTVYFNADSTITNGYAGEAIFVDCPMLTHFVFGDHLTRIPSFLVLGVTSIESIQLPANLRTIDDNAFANCHNLRHVDFVHTQLQSIGRNAFSATALESVVLPRSCTHIGASAFQCNDSLRYVCIMADSLYWGGGIFWRCPNIDTIRMFTSTPPHLSISFETEIPATTHLIVPCGAATTYADNTLDLYNWYYITDVEEMPAVAVMVEAAEGGSAMVLSNPTCDNLTAEIEAVADSGWHFTHWSDGDTNAHRTLAVGTDDIILTAHFSPDSPTVGIDIIDNPDEVRIIVNDRRVIVSGTTLPVNIYDIMGRREQTNSPLQPGVYIVRIGTTTRKIIVF